MFDQAKLAVVAYAQVSGADGLSTLCNSGITTSKVSTGFYALTLPNGALNTQTLAQGAASDLVIVTPTKAGTIDPLNDSPQAVLVDNSNATTKYVLIKTDSNGAVNSDFMVVIYRTLTP
jgi:hypothetical protein